MVGMIKAEESNTGLVHIYYGDGKGKTSIGMGMCIRAAGYGYNVLVYQFMKDNSSSERNILKTVPQITLKDGLAEEKFSIQMTDQEKQERRLFYQQMLDHIIQEVSQGYYQLLFLDEIIYTIEAGLLSEAVLISFLKQKPADLEVVLTGNGEIGNLIPYGDYISEVKKIKHPYDQGVPARRGIEK